MKNTQSDRPTPETDAEIDAENEYVDAEFARKLERERDEARVLIKETEAFADRFCKERDEAREIADQFKEMFDMQTKLVVDLEMRLLKMEEQLKNYDNN